MEKISAGYIETEWEIYKKRVLLPSNPGEIQLIESKKCFFAGAISLFALLMKEGTKGPDEQGVEFLEKVSKEFDNYVLQIQKEHIKCQNNSISH